MRNTYFYQGNPGIVRDKIKEKANQFDNFILMFGDGTVLESLTSNMVVGTEKTGIVSYKTIIVDVTYLCNSICDYALWYYENNQEKFVSRYAVITKEEFLNPVAEEPKSDQEDVFVRLLNEKSEKEGSTLRLAGNPNHKLYGKDSKDLREEPKEETEDKRKILKLKINRRTNNFLRVCQKKNMRHRCVHSLAGILRKRYTLIKKKRLFRQCLKQGQNFRSIIIL